MRQFLLVLPVLVTPALLALTGLADDKPYTPQVQGPSNEAQQAIKRFRLPNGVEASVWAAEPLLANPVSFCFDERGRCFVAETFRLHHGVTDNRGHMELARRRPRLAHRRRPRRHVQEVPRRPASRRVRNRARPRPPRRGHARAAGQADKATVFADGFQRRRGRPRRRRAGPQGQRLLHLHPRPVAAQGHEGRRQGRREASRWPPASASTSPSSATTCTACAWGRTAGCTSRIGDRGLNVTTKEGKHLVQSRQRRRAALRPGRRRTWRSSPPACATRRSWPSTQYGNLFTVDNNSDSGDRCRLVYIVEGGDSGWRTGYQYGSDLGDRGPFNAEKVWHLADPEQPAYIVPPLAHIDRRARPGCASTPARRRCRGATPSTSSSAISSGGEQPQRRLLVRGQAEGGVLRGRRRPRVSSGAFWRPTATSAPTAASTSATGSTAGTLTGKGRIYRFADAEAAKKPEVAEVKKLLAEGFDEQSNEELAKLLEHPDMRVRQEAQFALAEKGKEAMPTLVKVANREATNWPGCTPIWGLGQLGRRSGDVVGTLAGLLKDRDAEVRAQAARVLGWATESDADATCCRCCRTRSRECASSRLMALARTSGPRAGLDAGDVLMLRENGDRDAYLRHAGALVMARSRERLLVDAARTNRRPSGWRAVLALRHLGSPAIWQFLDDPDPQIATEAARAVHDVPIPDPLSGQQLADRLDRPKQPEFFLWRALNANFRLGKAKNALAVARFAANAAAPEKLRVEAVKMLGAWTKPGRRDRVTGLTQDLARATRIAGDALKASLDGIFSGPNAVRRRGGQGRRSLGIKEVGPVLFDLASDTKRPAAVRVEMLRALEALTDSRLAKATAWP